MRRQDPDRESGESRMGQKRIHRHYARRFVFGYSCVLSRLGNWRFLRIINRMALEPVFIANHAHLLQGGAAHAGREFTSFPGESRAKSDGATYRTPRNSLWNATATAPHVEPQQTGTGSNGSQT